MLQTLFHIPREIGGVPLFGFGLLLALWAVFSVGFLVWLGRRQGWNTETWTYVPLLILMGAVFAWLLPALAEPEGVPIRGYGVMMLIAVLSGVGLGAWRARRLGLDPDIIFTLAFWVFVPGILGARLFYVIEYWQRDFGPAFNGGFLIGLGAVLNVAKGGLVVFGSLIGGMLGLVAFTVKRNLPFLAICDLVAPSFALGQAIGRIGCLLNGCCFGGLCDESWAITFPPDSPPYQIQIDRGQIFGLTLSDNPNAPAAVEWVDPHSPLAGKVSPGDRLVAIGNRDVDSAGAAALIFRDLAKRPHDVEFEFEGRHHGLRVLVHAHEPSDRSLPVAPTQIFSAIDAFLLCLLLLAVDPYVRRDGQLFALGLGLHAIARFLLEIIRIDESPVFGTGLSISQNLSVLLLLAAVAIWVVSSRRPGRAFWDQASQDAPAAAAP